MKIACGLLVACTIALVTCVSASHVAIAQAQSPGLTDSEGVYPDDEQFNDSTDAPLPYWADPGDEQIDDWLDDGSVPDVADFLLMTQTAPADTAASITTYPKG